MIVKTQATCVDICRTCDRTLRVNEQEVGSLSVCTERERVNEGRDDVWSVSARDLDLFERVLIPANGSDAYPLRRRDRNSII